MGASKGFTPWEVKVWLWRTEQVKVSYQKAWRALSKALEIVYGNYEASYAKVPRLCA